MKFKTITIQIAILSGLLGLSSILILEIIPRVLKFKTNLYSPQTCYDVTIRGIKFNYYGCPNSYYIKDPKLDFPDMQYVESWVDNIGSRKPYSNWNFNEEFKTQKIFLIGDSFIQAEEIPYEKTLYGLINNESPIKDPLAYGFGYSSWNPIQFHKAIQVINKRNVLYDLFLFSNDFNPADDGSVYRQKKLKESKSLSLRNKTITWIGRKILNKSNIYTLIKSIYREKITNPTKQKEIFWGYYLKNIRLESMTCNILEHKYLKEFHPIMQNYIAFSLPSKCWKQEQEYAYKLVLKELLNSIDLANKLDSNIRIILIPPGWSFPHEVTGGRATYLYSIPSEITFSYEGLRERLKDDLKTKFFDLEPFLKSKIFDYKENDCIKKCDNSFYFSYDGHLNEKSHQLIHDYLYKKDKIFNN